MTKPILVEYHKDIPEGSQIVIIPPNVTAEELSEALESALSRLSSEIKVLVYDSEIVHARPYLCYKCEGSGLMEVFRGSHYPEYAECTECNGKGMLL